ncbi:DUF1376 domain-containing protein [Herminiimonas sp. CN]|uniref:DUF1376 domain-containing protein n=1 Tax=Herminiimonas sp. CN TaxID=1349818 RepID=UPI0012DC980D|nr:DUF1376 domain-containing protein [Herminiimonas sp. CN]
MANSNFWYARHFKDYAAKTAHLSLAEHGAYTMLLDHYYQSNGKLIANAMAIARVCRCQTEEERIAVQSVLDQFFILDDSGMYRNDRANKELGNTTNVSAARSAAGKAGAAARWRKSEEMASAMPGPLANTKQVGWQNDAQPQPQQHIKNMSDKSDVLQILDYLNQQTGRNYRPVKTNISLISARLTEGAKPDECRAVIDAKVSAWADDAKMSEYLRPKTLFCAINFAQYVGELSTRPAVQSWE